MSDTKLLLSAAPAAAGLGYCLWKIQADLRSGRRWPAAWGVAASLSSFIFLGLIFAGMVLKEF